MTKKTVLLAIFPILIFSSFSVKAEVTRDDLETVLQKALPELDIALESLKKGKALKEGKRTEIKIEGLNEFELKETQYVVCVLFFKELVEKHNKEIVKKTEGMLPNRKIETAKYPLIMLIGRVKDRELVKQIEIEKKAFYFKDINTKIDDFIGSGEKQLKLTFHSAYAFFDPASMVRADRLYLFGLPECKKYVSISTKVAKEDLFITRKIKFQKNKNNDLIVEEIKEFEYSENKRKIKTIQLKNSRYDIEDDKPWIEKKPEEPEGGSRLKLRIVNEEGKPVEGAMVRYHKTRVNPFTWGTKTKRYKEKTNANGEAILKLKHGSSLDITAEGYYKKENAYPVPYNKRVPKDWVTVVLQKQHRKVPTIEGGFRHIWEEKIEKIKIGLCFTGNKKADKAFEQERSDIWFEIIPTELEDIQRNDYKDWEIKIIPRNGWEIAPGPMKIKDPYGKKTMHVAVKEGYTRDNFKDRVSACPEGFYLRRKEKNGFRYGKLWRVRFKDMSWGEKIHWVFWIKFRIQTTSANSRSLNPKK